MELNTSQPGKYTGTHRIAQIDPPSKPEGIGHIRFEGIFIKEGAPALREIAYFGNQKFAEFIKVGDEKDITIEWSPQKTDPTKMFVRLASCRKPGSGGGWGGGGGSRVPTAEEIHAVPLATIIAFTKDDELDEAIDRYWAEIAKLRGQVPQNGNARPAPSQIAAELGFKNGAMEKFEALCIPRGLDANTIMVDGYLAGYRTQETICAWVKSFAKKEAANA